MGPISKAFILKYMDSDVSKKIDTTFGIRYDYNADKWMIGNKKVKLNADDSLMVGGDYYEGSCGFWNLVTNKEPNANYTAKDYERYKELLWETSALHQHYDADNQYPRSSGSKKCRKFLRPIWNEFHYDGIVEGEDYDDYEGQEKDQFDNEDEDWDRDTSLQQQQRDGGKYAEKKAKV